MSRQLCGCCAGIQAATSFAITNRPGLSSLSYRVGTYTTFFETMKASLSSPDYPALAALKTRGASDPAIALLDAWAVIGDVLTFYQERIANEGYLRTATERQSLINLAQLVGYSFRPGVSASIYLAYTVDPSSVPSSIIPAGSRVQSLPASQDALPQTFEIERDLEAKGAWNNLSPRLTQPQVVTANTTELYLSGVNSNLKPNSPLMIVAGDSVLLRVSAVEPQFAQNRTHVVLQTRVKAISKEFDVPAAQTLAATSVALLGPLMTPPAAHPSSALDLDRSVSQVFAPGADTIPAVLGAMHPSLQPQIYAGLANTTTPPARGQVRALRVQASPFGSSAPLKPIVDSNGAVIGSEEWPLAGSVSIAIAIGAPQGGSVTESGQAGQIIQSFQNATVSIRVADPAKSASRTFSLPQKSGDDKVGAWGATMQVNQSVELQIAFSPSLPTFKIGIDKGADTFHVTVDSAEPIQVTSGQLVSSAANGQRISISAVKNIFINYVSPIEPDATTLALDSIYDQIVPGSMVVIERPDWDTPRFTTVSSTQRVSISRYNLSARVTQLKLADPWLDSTIDRMLSAVRQATILTQDEQLELAPQPIEDDVAGDTIELGDLYSDLDSGRWMIVQGERTDTPTPGITGTELVMLASVEQGVKQIPATLLTPGTAARSDTDDSTTVSETENATLALPGDTTHSFLHLAGPLSYSYKRQSVTVHGNVVRATHGETRSEVLGSGDGSQTMQQFKLHYPQLTFVPASTAGGVQSSLQVKVNDIPWKEVSSLADAGPSDRSFVTQTDASGITTIQFGDGIHGMRLPTGVANIRASYRAGTGTSGNVDSGKAALLASRPLGVKSVINPIPSTAGADGETTEQGRGNTPLAVAGLDRLVSIQDYADYAQTFAAIGKSAASRISSDHCQIVYVTVAGSEGTLLDETSEPFLNLSTAFKQLGDPNLSIQIGIAEFMLLVISAQVQLSAGYQWEVTAPQIRAAVLAAFGFDQQKLGRSVFLSEVMSAIQHVDGVAYVRVTTLNNISESDVENPVQLTAKLAEISTRPPIERIVVRGARTDARGSLLPAQVAYLSAGLPDTLILTEVSA